MRKGLALLFFLLGSLAYAQNIVTISNAQKAEYAKDPISGGDMIILTGAVEVSVEDGGTKTTIFANSVTVNREKDLLYAEGGISLTRTGDGNDENMTAETLLINTKTFEGIFDGARIVSLGSTGTSTGSGTAATGSAGSTLIVSANLFGRDEKVTMAFKNGSLTFCDDDDPHWKINATRIWLLPGEEFALFNAFLYVGSVPVFYLPFFYYPKDELVMNPVIGYEDRKGYYFQTTTYIIGRKPLAKDEGDSQFNFMKMTSLKEQKLEGLMLHNLDEDLKTTSTSFLKFMGDYYSNLGYMLGIEGKVSPGQATTGVEGKKAPFITISGIDFAFYTGFSKTIYPLADNPNVYSSFFPSGDEYPDETNLFGLSVPFRYMANLNVNIVKPFSITASMPFYSDTVFRSDFLTREESMDWLSYITSNKGEKLINREFENTSTGEITSFPWTLNASYTVPVSIFTPYISSLSLRYGFDLTFATTNNTALIEGVPDGDKGALQQYSPMRSFFYPSQMSPAKAGASLSGTILTYPVPPKTTRTTSASSSATAPRLTPPEDIAPPVTETAPADSSDDSNTSDNSTDDSDTGDEDTEAFPEEDAVALPGEDTDTPPDAEEDAEALFGVLKQTGFPAITFTTPVSSNVGGVAYKLNYTVSPDLSTQSLFVTPKTPSETTWDDAKSSLLIFRSPVNLQSNVSWRDGFVGMTNAFNFAPVYQTHTFLSEDPVNGYTESQVKTTRYDDYAAKKLDLSANNSVSFKPFVYNPYFSGTGVTWNTNVLLIRTKFKPTRAEFFESGNPEWDYLTPEWDEESITAHALNFTFAAQEDAFSQSLTLSSTLPPRVDHYTLALTLGFPYISLTAGGGVGKVSKLDDTWKYDPLRQSAQISLFDKKLSITESYTYDMEEKRHSSFQTGVSGYGLSFSYTMQHTYGYDFMNESGNNWAWKSRKEQEFLPVSMSLSYSNNGIKIVAWKNRMQLLLGASTEFRYDMIRSTSSYFAFSPRLTFDVNQFLHISFTASSRNNTVFRYFQDVAGFPVEIPGEKNLFKDLANSFAFWDEDLRKSSGFKLQTFTFEITHELHDWLLNSRLSMAPRSISTSAPDLSKNRYETQFSLSVLWRPMQSIKTSIEDKDGVFTLNPKEETTTTK